MYLILDLVYPAEPWQRTGVARPAVGAAPALRVEPGGDPRDLRPRPPQDNQQRPRGLNLKQQST